MIDIVRSNIFSIQIDLTAICLLDSCQNLGQRLFSTTIRSRDDQHFAILDLKADMIDQTAFLPFFIYLKSQVFYF